MGAEVAIALELEDFGAGGSYKQMFRAKTLLSAWRWRVVHVAQGVLRGRRSDLQR